MELDHIALRFSESLKWVDDHTATQNSSRQSSSRGVVPYLLGVGTLHEHQFCQEAMLAWVKLWPQELPGFDVATWLEHPYPVVGLKAGRGSNDTCDVCLRSPEFSRTGGFEFEWAIEVKAVRFVGDNGKINEFAVNKAVSPYRTARSSVLDAQRLPKFTTAQRRAIVWYGFEFDDKSVPHAKAMSQQMGVAEDRAEYMASLLRSENPTGGDWTIEPMLPLFEAAAAYRGTKLSKRVEIPIEGLNRHPLYRRARVVAWEVW